MKTEKEILSEHLTQGEMEHPIVNELPMIYNAMREFATQLQSKPVEGDVNKTSPPTVEHLNELYELSDEEVIQGNEYYLRGFKDRENYELHPQGIKQTNKI